MSENNREEIMEDYDAAQKLIKMARFEDAAKYLKRCFVRCESDGDAASCETLLGELAICYEKAGRFTESIETLQRLLVLAGHDSPTRETAIIHHNLGFLHEMIKDLDGAERHFRKSAEIAEKAGDLRGHGVSLTMLSQILVMSNRHAEGLALLMKAMNVLQESDAPELETVIEYTRMAAKNAEFDRINELARRRIKDQDTLLRFLDS